MFSIREVLSLLLLAYGCGALSRRKGIVPHLPSYGGLGRSSVQPPVACAPLENRGTHFTVDVTVGTPLPGTSAQSFSVVADTGSNALIVPSCLCNSCNKLDKCFTGKNQSSSFVVEEGPGGGPNLRMITYGSGPIQGVVAKDVVRVGNLSVDMTSGLLLMTAQRLNIQGSFEGILGLGVPRASDAADTEQDAAVQDAAADAPAGTGGVSDGEGVASEQDAAEIIKQILGAEDRGGRAADDSASVATEMLDRVSSDPAVATPFSVMELGKASVLSGSSFPWPWSAAAKPESKEPAENVSMLSDPKGFLEEADIHRFSMCFNERGPGLLQLGGADEADGTTRHGSIGRLHWGLDMRGVSVGETFASVAVCDRASMSKGQETPCGMIPDSGTTLIMAPKAHIEPVLASICDGWERCKKNYTALLGAAEAAKMAAVDTYGIDPFGIGHDFHKSTVLKLLLSDCDRWLNESEDGLDELPPLNLHVAGPGGATNQLLALSGWAYVIESMEDTGDLVYQHYPGLGDVPVGVNTTGVRRKVCMPAISAMEEDYVTAKNGPIWIVGTPLFYEFTVGYHLKTDPPSMSFTATKDTPCGNCNSEQLSLASVGDAVELSRGKAWRPRRVPGARHPSIDVSQPL